MQVSTDLFHAKDSLAEGDVQAALDSCNEALTLSAELEDKRARRAVLRVTVRPIPGFCTLLGYTAPANKLLTGAA